MKLFSRLWALVLTLALISCGASSTPIVRDYTNGHQPRNVQPQSVVERCPPYEKCVGGGGGGGGGPCDLESQTLATVPADQTRTTIGVAEKVTITTSNGGALSVSSDDSSTLSSSSSPSTLTAGAQSGTATVTVAARGTICTQNTLAFTIVAPTADYYNDPNNGNVVHDQGLADLGKYSYVYLGPSTVNFSNLYFAEQGGTASGSGVWQCNGPHNPAAATPVSSTYDATKGWYVSWDDDEIQPTGALPQCSDTPYDAAEYVNSSFTLTIPLGYSLTNGPPWTPINTVTMQATDANNGQLTISKDQMSGSTTVNSPSQALGNP
jgi:hypothetical protein